jgi:hypothetical protein
VGDIRPLIDFWPIILSMVGYIVWLVRLEGRISQVDKDVVGLDKHLSELAAKHDSLDSKVVEQLSDVRESLARIEGALGVNRKDR